MWRPGQSGNPNGRPRKGETITDVFRAYLTAEGEERKKLFVEKVYEMALAGNVSAARLIWDHIDGLPRQQVEQNFGSLDESVEISIGGKKIE